MRLIPVSFRDRSGFGPPRISGNVANDWKDQNYRHFGHVAIMLNGFLEIEKQGGRAPSLTAIRYHSICSETANRSARRLEKVAKIPAEQSASALEIIGQMKMMRAARAIFHGAGHGARPST